MPPYEGTRFNYWFAKTAESSIAVDFLLPNGIFLTLEALADTSLADLKSQLWIKARDFPRFNKLYSENQYVLSCVSRKGEVEELLDEERSLFEIKPFKPYLKVVRKEGDEGQKLLNSRISMLIGISLSELNNLKVEEVEDFRMKYRNFCESVAKERGRASWIQRAIYTFPPEFSESLQIPKYLEEKIVDSSLTVSVLVYKSVKETMTFKFKVHSQSYPSDLINTILKSKASAMRLQEAEREEDFLLKVVGKQSYLLGSTAEKDGEEKYIEYPLIQYKYIRDCISSYICPQLCLVPRCDLKVEARARTLTSIDNPPPLPPKNEKNSISLWELSPDTMFRIKIVCAANINAVTMKKSIKGCLYHGGEPLCDIKNTDAVTGTNWNQFLDFNIHMIDLPRMSRLCLCIYGHPEQKEKKKKDAPIPLAWVNTTVFDYKGFLRTGPLRLYCWICDGSGLSAGELHPLGTVVSNTATESCPCILVEFSKFAEPVVFPPDDKVFELAAQVTRNHKGCNPLMVKGSSYHKAQLDEIIARDVLVPLFEQDKDLLWYLRAECCDNYPKSLSKLLQSIKWNSREDVAQMQFLLRIWRKDFMTAEEALGLLDYKFADLDVRRFSVDLLDQLKDSELEQYLLQLVQALKYESYLDCVLTRFLLKRALNNRRIGHFLFWNLRSEMHIPGVSVRFGLILEAYCRGSVGHVEILSRQYEAISKLKTVTELLQQSPLQDEGKKLYLMQQCFKHPAYQRAFTDVVSPLDPSIQLKQLRVEKCKYMKSKKEPLWLVFENEDELAPDVVLIFKNGDDLRQDMLTLQILRIMDNVWKSLGLNFHLSPYGCLSTGPNHGLIEVVLPSNTVSKIQTKKGSVLGSFKVDSLHSWILESNRKRLEDRKHAVQRFTQSCAGYCVATYVLGIADRHNDNIMTKESGELFHIDFGHILGNYKYKYGIRRERVPFVLASDFIYVINDGQGTKDGPAMERFKSLCALAFQYLRQKGNLFVTLFAIMLSSGIPELRSPEDLDYVRRCLALTKSVAESQTHFDEIFKEAKDKSWTTSLNWLAHNIKHS